MLVDCLITGRQPRIVAQIPGQAVHRYLLMQTQPSILTGWIKNIYQRWKQKQTLRQFLAFTVTGTRTISKFHTCIRLWNDPPIWQAGAITGVSNQNNKAE